MINCVTIDDEPLARECVAGYISKVGFLKSVAEGNNPVELMALLDIHQVDLIFLDIQMPLMNGIEFLKIASNPPMVIITTAYPTYALEGFQLDVLDYLVKPITFDRFLKAASKAKDYNQLVAHYTPIRDTAELPVDYFFIKCDYKYERIYFQDVLYIQGLQNYVTIHTVKGKHITKLAMKNVEEHLQDQQFIRVHKSYIVSIPKIEAIDNNEICIQAFRIPISRNYHEEVIEKVINNKLWRK